jgi:glycosyltransferase involved in cell wall biosynthesis
MDFMLNQNNHKNTAPISVIIPCYNCSKTLLECVTSVLNQTLLPSEILLLDDCSSDLGATKKCMEEVKFKYGNQINIKTFFSDTNNGPGSTRNLGWEKAKNSYIAFIDSDDVWEPNKIMCQWNYLKENPEVQIIGSNIKETEICPQEPMNKVFKMLKPKDLLFKNPFCNSSVVLAKNIPYRFEEKSYFSEDFMLWAKIICDQKLQAFYLPHKFSSEVLTPNKIKGLSTNYLKMYLGELKVLKYISKRQFNFFVYYLSACFLSLKLIRRLIKSCL